MLACQGNQFNLRYQKGNMENADIGVNTLDWRLGGIYLSPGLYVVCGCDEERAVRRAGSSH